MVRARSDGGRSFRVAESGADERRLPRPDPRTTGHFAWIGLAGDGKDWLQMDLQSHHHENHPQYAITRADQTTSYTKVAALDELSVILTYNGIPHGWSAIPTDSKETNSIWVVRVAMEAARTRE